MTQPPDHAAVHRHDADHDDRRVPHQPQARQAQARASRSRGSTRDSPSSASGSRPRSGSSIGRAWPRSRRRPSSCGSAAQLGPLLWTRRPEHWSFLSLRLGSAAMPSRNTVDDDQRGDLLFEFQERLDEVIESPPPGRRRAHRRRARRIRRDRHRRRRRTPPPASSPRSLVQLTGLHSPAELVVAAALTPEWAAELDWLKWLPHTSSPHSPLSGNHLAATEPAVAVLMDDLEGLIVERERVATRAREPRAARWPPSAPRSRPAPTSGRLGVAEGYAAPVARGRRRLVADHAMRDRSRLVDLSERGADVGVFPVWIAADGARLPAVCRTFADLGATRRARRRPASASASCASARRSRPRRSTGSRATRRSGMPAASAASSTRTCRWTTCPTSPRASRS